MELGCPPDPAFHTLRRSMHLIPGPSSMVPNRTGRAGWSIVLSESLLLATSGQSSLRSIRCRLLSPPHFRVLVLSRQAGEPTAKICPGRLKEGPRHRLSGLSAAPSASPAPSACNLRERVFRRGTHFLQHGPHPGCIVLRPSIFHNQEVVRKIVLIAGGGIPVLRRTICSSGDQNDVPIELPQHDPSWSAFYRSSNSAAGRGNDFAGDI